MTEAQIQRTLHRHFRKSLAIVPNVFLFGEESDILRVMKNGWVIEYEIKLSKSDFRSDLRKKGRHKYMAERIIEPVSYWYKGNNTHRTPKSPELAKSWTIPNRFAFVCPEELLSSEDMPEYAGLYHIRGGMVITIKRPPLLHREKINNGSLKRLVSVLSHRLWNLKLEALWINPQFKLPDTLRTVTVEIDGDGEELRMYVQYDRDKGIWCYINSDMRIRGKVIRWREL